MSAMVDDDLWSAVGDPTRRRMIDLLLGEGGGTATSLSEHLPVTRQAVAKHLAVLDRVGLVHASTRGRERHYRVDEDQLARAVAQFTEVGNAWDARMQRIKRIAERIQRGRDGLDGKGGKSDTDSRRADTGGRLEEPEQQDRQEQ
ncbi:ArsR/SmtB family transcription factor [Glycomyces harbinensis]|uniref:DNA-binding transcriptional regulator, ArsR family n=1 Tax=Glycomyces harbinensis TaxID=58114 RepID=A0A1G7CDS9_9ACTN|nr:metalloregulator ArsR/SmtB family transcription factor [Glycomyces harbinensis]SDE37544.1 DNA-binding transcriptional regulator, ArsR family [Glycomyces harbinensis]